MQGSLNFIDQWIDYLETTPWADTECLNENLKYENAISWPVYFIQYETSLVDGFKVESHTLWNEEENKPDICYLEKIS